MKEIFDYSDYRQFIKDYYDTHRATNPGFSLRYLSQKAGINSSAFFKFIIEGKRNLTKGTILKVCNAIRLKDKEAEYFEDLVFFNQARTIEEKNHFFDRLIEMQRVRNVKIIREDQYDYFSQWYHCIIRELICMIDFKDDYRILAKCVDPPITAAQAEESVNLLIRLGFIVKRDDGYIQSEPVVSTGNSIKSHHIVKFQIEMLKKAIESFDRHQADKRMTSSTTFAVSLETYWKFVNLVRDLRRQLMEMARTDEHPDHVYQLNLNLFPVGKANKENDGSRA